MEQPKAIILFDGVCNLCNGFVQFVIRHDRAGYFKFASLQSEVAKPYLKACPTNALDLNSVVLWENGICYDRSTAALKIFKRLSGLWFLAYGAMVVPAVIRNAVYNLIARNRYRWFGQQESCMLPTPELKSRFL